MESDANEINSKALRFRVKHNKGVHHFKLINLSVYFKP